MCLTEGQHGATAENIFAATENHLDSDNIHFQNCVSLIIDNASTLVGKRNSLTSRFKDKNSEIFIIGCPSHLSHIAASHANDKFSEVLGLNVGNLCINIFYWFDKSSKRNGKLIEYFQFCDQEYQSVLKHASVRWLSLEKCVSKTLKEFESLKLYLLSENGLMKRFNVFIDGFPIPLLNQH